MIAVVKAFTQYTSLSKYLSICSSLLLKKSTELPSCMLRNDFNHVMHVISTWPEIKSSSYRLKNFYLRSIGLIIASKDFEDVKYLLKNMFIVSLSEECGLNSDGVSNLCQAAKVYLKTRIAIHGINYDDILLKHNDVVNNLEDETDSMDNIILPNDTYK